MIRMVNKNERISVAQLGDLHPSEKLQTALPILEKKWA